MSADSNASVILHELIATHSCAFQLLQSVFVVRQAVAHSPAAHDARHNVLIPKSNPGNLFYFLPGQKKEIYDLVKGNGFLWCANTPRPCGMKK